MDRRLILNIIIVGILSFYLIFGIAYRGLLEESEPDLIDQSAWQQPYLIPKNWQLTKIEFLPSETLHFTESGWRGSANMAPEVAALIANNWSGLVVQDISDYSSVPEGQTALVFVEQQQGPIVYRLVSTSDSLLIHRLDDKKLFRLPAQLKSVLWID